MQEYTVESSKELFELLHKFKEGWSWIFRGQSDADWNLLPRVGRPEFRTAYAFKHDEKKILGAWKRYAVHFMRKTPADQWDWLTLAQHHGLATRLLDWTKSPLNAAFFAIDRNKDGDAVVFALEILNEDVIKDDDPFEVDDFGVFFPRGLSARVVNQRGLFTISGKPSIPLEEQIGERLHKITVTSSAIESISESLELFGVNKLSIYQDLDHLSEHLNDYFRKVAADIRAPLINDELPIG
jgi:hypothetical protein